MPISAWLNLELKPTTDFAAWKLASSMISGLLLMIQLTPSLQGGVVRDPTYLKTVLAARCACKAPNVSGGVVVASPTFGILETEGRTVPKRGSAVGPSSRRKLTTAMDLSALG